MKSGPKPKPLEERFWTKVEVKKSSQNGCWLWKAGKYWTGYGQFYLGQKQHKIQAHRFAYEQFYGPIPEGLQLDHLCRNRACVNPLHLEPVTGKENIQRSPLIKFNGEHNRSKIYCPKGHLYDGDNLRIWRGRRICRECTRAKARDWQRRHRKIVITEWAAANP